MRKEGITQFILLYWTSIFLDGSDEGLVTRFFQGFIWNLMFLSMNPNAQLSMEAMDSIWDFQVPVKIVVDCHTY